MSKKQEQQQEDEEFSDASDENFDARHPTQDPDRDFDDFDDYPGSPSAAAPKSSAIANQPFDEAVELSDEESEASPANKPGGGGAASGGGKNMPIANQPFDEAVELSSDGGSVDGDGEAGRYKAPGGGSGYSPPRQEKPHGAGYARRAEGQQQGGSSPASSAGGADSSADLGKGVQRNFAPPAPIVRPPEQEEDGAESPGGMGDTTEPVVEGMYDPSEYEHLGVSQEVQELFQYITRYKPHHIELETKMKPFIADYIPAVGEIDAFVKVPRPDSKPDNLGLTVLDEPASNQSDPTVFTLQLRAVTKSSAAQPMLVRSIELAEKNPKSVSNWVNSINDLHRHKPAPSVRYSKPMPDIEALMQIWPQSFEELLETARLPDAELAVELPELVRVMCGILDIPVYSSAVESLHVLFTLYSDFKANVVFQQQLQEETNQLDVEAAPAPA